MTENWKWIVGVVLIPIFAALLPRLLDSVDELKHTELEYHWVDYIKVGNNRVFKLQLFNFSTIPQANLTIRLPKYIEPEDVIVDSDGDSYSSFSDDKYLNLNFGSIRKNQPLTIKFLVKDHLLFVDETFFDQSVIMSDSHVARKYSYEKNWDGYYKGGFFIALFIIAVFVITHSPTKQNQERA